MTKGAGVIAYTVDGRILVVYENVGYWSLPKGHYEEKDADYMQTAVREFKEETSYPYDIVLDKNKKMRIGDRIYYLYKLNRLESQELKPDGIETLLLHWVHMDDMEDFAQRDDVNTSIKKFKVNLFKKLAGFDKAPKALNIHAKAFVFNK